MDLRPYLDSIRYELAIAAQAAGDEAHELAERLTSTLHSATRLALLNALSDAADEITRDLAPGSVEVRLRGVDPTFVVTPPPTEPPESGAAPPFVAPPVAPIDDSGGTSRINVRLPDRLKQRVEEAASREGLSVNAWLVRAAAAALEPRPATATGWGVPPTSGGNTFKGWAR
ncbi:toxin-antitoxin system HicB family antitoxin [Nocardia puris]|uniref:HicB-like protein involved in pilus formation n=1 Tax=Nocardia puris TaxID=208602 RepID=A0A366DD35_9NOCA|nr:toxin-antitoxin system HicB family antitoxin [Nocardia puris]MBF6211140.1 toxin-antitoxin system HicB family antitoxin [Nocardia puris]MBF6364859.1 toxin-antitoxin system HicB family antitoxin [Nocardia puris]MBF6458645.1 toxin-antitoxin system HicB family antitoxin [Nocardia puris]RBO87855.1 HicB-like protein involved in pilus formation [Nocardia puris]